MSVLRSYLDKFKEGAPAAAQRIENSEFALSMKEQAQATAANVKPVDTSALDRKVNSLGDPDAAPYLGDDPIVKARLSKGTDTNIPYEPAELYTKGVDEEEAEQLFQRSLERDQKAVREVLKSVGVKEVPQRTFDGLVSFYQHTGDITYVYYDEEKIDMMGLYAEGDWERVARFIGRDDRNRWRRSKEVAAMLFGDYGQIDDNKSIIKRGLDEAAGLIQKGKYNYLTGDAASWEQKLAAGSSYFRNTGKMMPGLDFTTKSKILENLKTNNITDLVKKQAGPWKY